ncbi:MAG: zinc metalloprotease [Sphingobacteriales bacterium]|nr:MAG: zinc metalloprotease [Sphingobacteriales bacterium]
MKKILSLVIAATLIAIACNKADRLSTQGQEETVAAPTKRMCASMEVLQEQLKADPSLQKRMDDLEKITQNFIRNKSLYRLSGDTMIVPVVVNVVYRTATENIALGQIQSQIDVLNEDYSGKNADVSGVPSIFKSVKAGDTKIRFVLDQVVRKSTTKRSWSTNDAVKKSSQGGVNPTSPTTKLNIWVCTLGQGLLGYAQFPGGNSATDGVVILNSAFGSRAKFPGGYYTATYDLGRTTTHEVGHWFNLRHIWGDATCGDDLVADTPQANAANFGCPAYPHYSTCTGTPVEMTMNYMDYTDDACMYMFSAGQASRMQATWIVGGPRASFR